MNNDAVLKLINDQIAALEAIRAEIQRLTAPTIPVPEMVAIPAPRGGAYTLLEGDGQRPVPIAAFAIGKYPLTQAEWVAVMGTNPSYFKGDPRCPVENVSWDDAVAFCERLSDSLDLTGDDRYRLPTEAEWEWAASGGVREDRRVTDDTGWYADNSGGQTHPVGLKKPNGYGLYDMSGNVWEWTSTEGGLYRVIRGGGWLSTPARAGVAFRGSYAPGVRYQILGFRLARGGK